MARHFPLRRGLLWVLAGTLALSALALWWPAARPLPLVGTAALPALAAGPAAPSVSSAVVAPLPATLPRPDFRMLGSFDPFAGPAVVPQAAQALPPPALPAAAPAEPAPPPPLPPVARLIGRMSDPAGARLLLLEDGPRIVAVQPGAELSDGYVVKAVDHQNVTLHHPGTQATVALPLPPEEELHVR